MKFRLFVGDVGIRFRLRIVLDGRSRCCSEIDIAARADIGVASDIDIRLRRLIDGGDGGICIEVLAQEPVDIGDRQEIDELALGELGIGVGVDGNAFRCGDGAVEIDGCAGGGDVIEKEAREHGGIIDIDLGIVDDALSFDGDIDAGVAAVDDEIVAVGSHAQVGDVIDGVAGIDERGKIDVGVLIESAADLDFGGVESDVVAGIDDAVNVD